jgi:hypothetical protein
MVIVFCPVFFFKMVDTNIVIGLYVKLFVCIHSACECVKIMLPRHFVQLYPIFLPQLIKNCVLEDASGVTEEERDRALSVMRPISEKFARIFQELLEVGQENPVIVDFLFNRALTIIQGGHDVASYFANHDEMDLTSSNVDDVQRGIIQRFSMLNMIFNWSTFVSFYLQPDTTELDSILADVRSRFA